MDKEIMKGSIDILLLSLMNSRDMYGYEMVKELKENSDELYSMSEGTLYPALKRLETKKFLTSYWEESNTGAKRKYYQITKSGTKELSRKLKEWEKVSQLIQSSSEGKKWRQPSKPIFNES